MSPHASCLQIARHLDALRATMRSIRPRLLVVALEEELVDQAQSARSAQKVRDQLKLRLLDIQLAHHPVVMPHVLLKPAGKVNDARWLLVRLIGGSTQTCPEPRGAKVSVTIERGNRGGDKRGVQRHNVRVLPRGSPARITLKREGGERLAVRVSPPEHLHRRLLRPGAVPNYTALDSRPVRHLVIERLVRSHIQVDEPRCRPGWS